jgi:agmatine deiminase
MKYLKTTPVKDGFRMPAEFAMHECCYLAWPTTNHVWYDNAKPAQSAFKEVAVAISKFENVKLCVSLERYYEARAILPKEIELIKLPYDDAWMRDIGPTFLTNGKEIRGIYWKFNSWGGFLPSWKKDEKVAEKILQIENLPVYKTDMVFEGGSIHVDGEGTLITTEECLLNPNRNHKLSKLKIEKMLSEYLNIKKIIWLKKGLYLDETSGHVDNLCCFVRPGEVALVWTNDKSDPQYLISNEAFKSLKKVTDAKGRKLKIHKISQPKPMFMTKKETEGISEYGKKYNFEGKRLAASYLNFYIANKGIIMPSFDDPNDDKAKKIIQKIFPEYKVVQVKARNIVLGGGGIHCITQQKSKVKTEKK